MLISALKSKIDLLISTAIGLLTWWIQNDESFKETYLALRKSLIPFLGPNILPEVYDNGARLFLSVLAAIVIFIAISIIETPYFIWKNKKDEERQRLLKVYKQVLEAVLRHSHDQIQADTTSLKRLPEEAMQHHKKIVLDALRDIRQVLREGYNSNDDPRATLMLVGKRELDHEEKLYIQFYSNAGGYQPKSYTDGLGFEQTKSYCGKAWRTKQNVRGTKKKWLLLNDPEYLERTSQRNIKCFFCIPVTAPHPQKNRQVLCVLNLDSTKHGYFPRQTNRQEALVEALNPLIIIASLNAGKYNEAEMAKAMSDGHA